MVSSLIAVTSKTYLALGKGDPSDAPVSVTDCVSARQRAIFLHQPLCRFANFQGVAISPPFSALDNKQTLTQHPTKVLSELVGVDSSEITFLQFFFWVSGQEEVKPWCRGHLPIKVWNSWTIWRRLCGASMAAGSGRPELNHSIHC